MKYIPICVLFIMLVSCGPTVKTSFDYDKHADFKKYKTYSYSKDAIRIPVKEANRNRLIKAIDHEMSARGFTKADSSDMEIDLLFKMQEGLQQRATDLESGLYGDWSYGYGPGFTTSRIDLNEYVEGTLFIIVADRRTNNMLWQGRGTKVLDEDASTKKRENNIDEAVAMIFKSYPATK